MSDGLKEVAREVLKRIKPSPEEEAWMKSILSETVSTLCEEFKHVEPEAEVLVEGSVAKGTWLSGEADADLFIRFPVSWSRDEMGKTLIENVKRIFGGEKCRMRFAEHPYVTVTSDKINIDIVPCYKVEKGFFKSATDRTPFHTEFMKSRLTVEMKDEARLLKRFFKGIEVYGAEIKTRGFSGFLVELLVYSLGGFKEALEALRGFKSPLILDPGGLYKDRGEELARRARGSLLCVIDPVDELRNVAAAVSGESLSIAQHAAHLMLEKPDSEFFYPTYRASKAELKETVRNRRLNVVSVSIPVWTKIPDILWGQAYRLLSRFSNLFEENDFKVLMEKAWSDEEKSIVLLFLLEEVEKQAAVLHMGPPYFSGNVHGFIGTYLGSERTLVHPFPRNGRWWVILKPKARSAVEVIKSFSSSEFLKGFPEPVVKALSESVVRSGESIVDAVENPGYLSFVEKFIHPFPWISKE